MEVHEWVENFSIEIGTIYRRCQCDAFSENFHLGCNRKLNVK